MSDEFLKQPEDATESPSSPQETFPSPPESPASSPVDPEAEKADREFLSPTLNDIPSQKLPEQDGACQHCPAGMWFYRGDSLTCFCLAMRAISYSDASEDDKMPFLSCDGMYLALEKMQSKRA